MIDLADFGYGMFGSTDGMAQSYGMNECVTDPSKWCCAHWNIFYSGSSCYPLEIILNYNCKLTSCVHSFWCPYQDKWGVERVQPNYEVE